MLIRDHPEARWLPARSHFALFRLLSYLRLRLGPVPSNQVMTVYAVDRDQNAFEHFAVATVAFIATTTYIAALLARWLPAPAATAIAIVITPAATHVPFFIGGLLIMPAWRRISGRPGANNLAANSFLSAAVILGCSVYFVRTHGVVRVVAATVLALVVVNALAAIVMWMIRKDVRDLEARCGA